MRFKTLIFLTLVTFLLASCQPTTTDSTTTETTTPSPTPATELTIESTSSSLEADGTYTVVGLVANHTAEAVTGVILRMRILDEDGASLLNDGRGNSLPSTAFSPLIVTLAPGESTPFIYIARFETAQPETFEVTVDSSTPLILYRPAVQVDHTALAVDDQGWVHLSGEIINLDTQPVLLMGLAGAVQNAAGNLVSAENADTFTTYLAASGDANGLDRTPFAIALRMPAGASAEDFRVFPDPVTTAPASITGLRIEEVHSYQDINGQLHICGWLVSDLNQTTGAILVAGIYSESGEVLDAHWDFSPAYSLPGARIPFSLSGFSSLEASPELTMQVNSVTVQLDLGNTSLASIQLQPLDPQIESVEQEPGIFRVSGSAVNSSSSPLALASVLIWAEDADGNLAGVVSGFLTPEDGSYDPGESIPFTLDCYLDAAADPAALVLHAYMLGEVR
jgi:hypothetical protein